MCITPINFLVFWCMAPPIDHSVHMLMTVYAQFCLDLLTESRTAEPIAISRLSVQLLE